jgi:hypothetical protein
MSNDGVCKWTGGVQRLMVRIFATFLKVKHISLVLVSCGVPIYTRKSIDPPEATKMKHGKTN